MSPARRASLFFRLCIAVLALHAASTAAAAERAGFASVFADSMVLQRERPLAFFGRAAPGRAVTVAVADRVGRAVADGDGRWAVTLPALPAGGPHDVELKVGGQRQQILRDVLVGDVWLCSGQSNMVYPVSRASGNLPPAPVAEDRFRLLTVAEDSAPAPRDELEQRPEWRVADQDTIADFSAVCWFFGREMQPAAGAPVGLIDASWGGSQIEAWIDADGLERVSGYSRPLRLLETYAADPVTATADFAAEWEAWWRNGHPGERSPPWQAAADDSRWSPVPGPLSDWKTWGVAALEGHDGMVWYARPFTLTAEQAESAADLSLGGIDEVDVTWVNGVFIGSEFGWGTPRRYHVPASVLKPGTNTVVVSVQSTWSAGGLVGPADEVRLEFPDEASVPIGDGWRYYKADAGLEPPRAPWESIGGLTGLHNAMLAPFAGLGIAGVVWYQGESDAGDADSYDQLLEVLIAGWRRMFDPALPVLIVQLPNFGALPTAPVESGWAEVRDAQRRVAERDARTGLVVTVDLGDRTDLHPPNKLMVARRAAAALRALQAADGTADGIGPWRAFRQGGDVVVEFRPAATRLVVVGDDDPIAFELCGDDGCAYAEATLADNRVRLRAASVEKPNRVRHCWADAPVCNLYGESGLPVSTFEIAID